MTVKSNNDKHDAETTTGAPDLDNQGRDCKKQNSGNSDSNAIGVDIGTSKIVFAQKKSLCYVLNMLKIVFLIRLVINEKNTNYNIKTAISPKDLCGMIF